MSVVTALLADLAAEHDALDAVVAGLDEAAWSRPTPAEGWDVRDSVSHLAYFDEAARTALVDPDGFRVSIERLAATGPGADVALGRSMPSAELVGRWRRSRAQLVEAAGTVDPSVRVPWYGPAMSVASFLTARLMETWAHGQDVVDALGAEPVVSDRLRHVVHIGVGARPYAYRVNRRPDPGAPIRVEAVAPGGDVWSWGPEHATDRVRGSALDLALVLTRRRHPADVDLEVEGPAAAEWITIAQTFAGPPGPARAPGLGRGTAP